MTQEEKYCGKSEDITLSNNELKEIIRDNPAGQGKETTPFILIRRKYDQTNFFICYNIRKVTL